MSLKQLLENKKLIKAVGAYNGMNAKLIENAGFDAVWASGLEISASYGYVDANMLTMTEFIYAAKQMVEAVNIPVIADCDNGFGGVNNVVRTVQEYEKIGVSAICIEDKVFPKMNSFIDKNQGMLSTEDFCAKIIAAVSSRKSKNFLIIARTESFILGETLETAIYRANKYLESGADLVLIHSKSKNSFEVEEFISQFEFKDRIVIVPTTYSSFTYSEMEKIGVKMVIHANHLLRSNILKGIEFLDKLKKSKNIGEVESEIATVNDIFKLQEIDRFLSSQKTFEDKAKKIIGSEKDAKYKKS